MGGKAKPLDAGYTAEFKNMDSDAWHRILTRFSDANLYQTWSYDAVRSGEKNVSHFVLRCGARIVAAAQARIVHIPLTGLAVAYIRWGPLWQQQGELIDLACFRMAIRELRNEYVCRRGWILRLLPAIYSLDSDRFRRALLEEGYESARGTAQRTLILDLRPSIDELRTNLEQKWRNCLNKAEKQGLALVEGTDDELFIEFISIYQQLLERKQFRAPSDINESRMIQRDLPDEFKMRVFICRSGQSTSAGAVFNAVGETGIYLFGATSDQGMKNSGSYLLQWKAIQWMRNKGCQYYNLNGINPSSNPGTYHFKAGVAGKNGVDVHYIGQFDSYSGPIVAKIAHSAEFALPLLKRISSAIYKR